MNGSPLTAGLMMVSLGLLPALFAMQQGLRISPLGAALAAGLICGGLLVAFLRKPVSFYIALVAGVATVCVGLAGLVVGRGLAMPHLPPALAIAFGIYVSLRVVLARSAFLPQHASFSDEKFDARDEEAGATDEKSARSDEKPGATDDKP